MGTGLLEEVASHARLARSGAGNSVGCDLGCSMGIEIAFSGLPELKRVR